MSQSQPPDSNPPPLTPRGMEFSRSLRNRMLRNKMLTAILAMFVIMITNQTWGGAAFGFLFLLMIYAIIRALSRMSLRDLIILHILSRL